MQTVTFMIAPDILMNVLEDYIIFLVWAAWVLIFILSKNKGFQSGALLKMTISFPSMEEFCLDIQSERRLFPSLCIHYNNILNTEVTKQNEPK